MGFPSPAEDYSEERISLDKEIIRHPHATYFMKMEGNAMSAAYIPAGALLVIDRSLTARHMDIVIAVIDGEFMARYLKKNDFKASLFAPDHMTKEIQITPEMQVVIWGVVIAVVIDPKHITYVRARGL